MVNQKQKRRTQPKAKGQSKRVFQAHRHIYRSVTACKGVGIYHLTVHYRDHGQPMSMSGYQILDTTTKKPLSLKVFKTLVEARQASQAICAQRDKR